MTPVMPPTHYNNTKHPFVRPIVDDRSLIDASKIVSIKPIKVFSRDEDLNEIKNAFQEELTKVLNKQNQTYKWKEKNNFHKRWVA